jgi:hypothetical protein
VKAKLSKAAQGFWFAVKETPRGFFSPVVACAHAIQLNTVPEHTRDTRHLA